MKQTFSGAAIVYTRRAEEDITPYCIVLWYSLR